MQSAVKDKAYKSPVRKLARFFEKSRDQWKAKHHQAKASVKRLKNRVRFLDQSKEHWKKRAQELEREVARLKAREQALARAEEPLEKKERRRSGRAGQAPGLDAGSVPSCVSDRVHRLICVPGVVSSHQFARCESGHRDRWRRPPGAILGSHLVCGSLVAAAPGLLQTDAVQGAGGRLGVDRGSHGAVG